ncbi:MAG: CRISPR-associated endonuclease Cas2 [Acidimicrobiales bacterium]
MSARRRWLVAYDIRDDVRLRKVYDIVRSHGDRLQYSVFLCDLDSIERLGLMSELRPVIDHRVDSVAFIDLGEPGRQNSAAIEFMGSSLPLPSGGPTIV